MSNVTPPAPRRFPWLSLYQHVLVWVMLPIGTIVQIMIWPAGDGAQLGVLVLFAGVFWAIGGVLVVAFGFAFRHASRVGSTMLIVLWLILVQVVPAVLLQWLLQSIEQPLAPGA